MTAKGVWRVLRVSIASFIYWLVNDDRRMEMAVYIICS